MEIVVSVILILLILKIYTFAVPALTYYHKDRPSLVVIVDSVGMFTVTYRELDYGEVYVCSILSFWRNFIALGDSTIGCF